MMMKKAVSMALLFAMLFTAAACSSPANDDNNAATTTAAAETEPEMTDLEKRNAISDDLPESNFEGYEFRILSYGDWGKYVICEEQNGEVINDATYTANMAVAERFNVKLTLVPSGGDDVSHVNTIKKSIQAGDDAFDLAYGHDGLTGQAALENLFVNLYEVPHLNFSKPWWPENTVNSLTILDQMYVFSNSISYLGTDWTRVLFMNKDKAADYNVEVPYQQVFDGTWNFEMLQSMTRDVYTDVNGDEKKDKDDFYGFSYTGPFYCFFEAFGIEPYVKDEEEIIVMNIDNPRTYTLIEKMYSLLFEQQGSYYINDYAAKVTMFSNSKALIVYCEIGDAIKTIRYTDVNYGMLPMPKLDELQKQYYAGYTDKLYVIPNTVTDLDRTGVIVEAMSAEGYKKVFPAYYDIALKNKYLQDEESVRMLDLINEGRVLDFSYIYIGTFNMTLSALFETKPSKDFASFYAKNQKTEQGKLDKLIAAFEGMGKD